MKAVEGLEHEQLKNWIYERAKHLKPSALHVCTGTAEESDALLEGLCAKGQAIRIPKRPGCFLFRSDPRDVARVESKTFVCSQTAQVAGVNNRWGDPDAFKACLERWFDGAMQGRTLYVVPFCMGPIGSPYSRIGVQLTDSPYVVCSMRIMTRMGSSVLEALGTQGSYVACLHSVGMPLAPGQKDSTWPCNPDKVCIAHFPEANLIYSFGSGYGGNALLGKKCLGLRMASIMGKQEGWLAEHMLLMGVKDPQGQKSYIAAAFPSACGKTNLAMLQPPEGMKDWTVTTLGDDIAWIHPGKDGRLYAINPETGFFGVAPGTGPETNPNALMSCARNSLFTNVALTDDGDVWWEGLSEPPAHLTDWQGCHWTPGCGRPATHPNARFTAPILQCPSRDPDWEKPVPLDAIVFGARRSTDVPLVLESLNWVHGVQLGANLCSEQTAAADGTVGQLRKDPMAMLPFCGYAMEDYIQHWQAIGKTLAHPPKIFQVNFFRKGAYNDFLWPGFGQNLRVLAWIFQRVHGKVPAQQTPEGLLPFYADFPLKGLEYSQERWDALQRLGE